MLIRTFMAVSQIIEVPWPPLLPNWKQKITTYSLEGISYATDVFVSIIELKKSLIGLTAQN